MAQQTTTVLVDDIDGSASDNVARRRFMLDGVHYEIDLNLANRQRLNAAFAEVIRHGRRVGTRLRGPVSPASAGPARLTAQERSRAIRAWAARNGHDLAPRGRIPDATAKAFDAAHQQGGVATDRSCSPNSA
ncbi:MAG: Lsr2 family protein [Umezawaea sp.]